jgi:hypothetical protein
MIVLGSLAACTGAESTQVRICERGAADARPQDRSRWTLTEHSRWFGTECRTQTMAGGTGTVFQSGCLAFEQSLKGQGFVCRTEEDRAPASR